MPQSAEDTANPLRAKIVALCDDFAKIIGHVAKTATENSNPFEEFEHCLINNRRANQIWRSNFFLSFFSVYLSTRLMLDPEKAMLAFSMMFRDRLESYCRINQLPYRVVVNKKDERTFIAASHRARFYDYLKVYLRETPFLTDGYVNPDLVPKNHHITLDAVIADFKAALAMAYENDRNFRLRGRFSALLRNEPEPPLSLQPRSVVEFGNAFLSAGYAIKEFDGPTAESLRNPYFRIFYETLRLFRKEHQQLIYLTAADAFTKSAQGKIARFDLERFSVTGNLQVIYADALRRFHKMMTTLPHKVALKDAARVAGLIWGDRELEDDPPHDTQALHRYNLVFAWARLNDEAMKTHPITDAFRQAHYSLEKTNYIRNVLKARLIAMLIRAGRPAPLCDRSSTEGGHKEIEGSLSGKAPPTLPEAPLTERAIGHLISLAYHEFTFYLPPRFGAGTSASVPGFGLNLEPDMRAAPLQTFLSLKYRSTTPPAP